MTESYTTRLAIGISIASFFFATFQWWESGQQHRINTAVELSKYYVTEPEVTRRYNQLLVAVKRDPRELDESTDSGREKLLPLRSYVDFIDYISYLVNQGQIDNAYIAERIKCDTAYMVEKFDGKPEFWRIFRVTEIGRYVAAKRHADCRDSGLLREFPLLSELWRRRLDFFAVAVLLISGIILFFVSRPILGAALTLIGNNRSDEEIRRAEERRRVWRWTGLLLAFVAVAFQLLRIMGPLR